MNIAGLFPIPVGSIKLPRPFSKKELNFVKLMSDDVVPNSGLNTTSVNNYILDDPIMEDLKKFCQDSVLQFINAYNPPKNEDITFYITQSWLNFNKKNQGHHKHSHPNSFVSGVLYINAIQEVDKIFFGNPITKPLRYTPKDWNVFNSEEWFISVDTGDLLLFPSTLTHCVRNNTLDHTRISLSFNTFIKGALGENQELTELFL
jgi:uncharacterized protein (TIGR02466 family)